MLVASIDPAFSAAAKKSGAKAVAGHGITAAQAIAIEITLPIVTDEVMKTFGMSGSDGIDYAGMSQLVKSVVRDQNRKQTMAALLGKLGGVEKTVEEIFSHVKADKNRGVVNSATDQKVTDLITDLSRPLNEVLAAYEGAYVGEQIGIVEPYMMASHLRLSLALLQKRRAEANIARYKNAIDAAKKATAGAKKNPASKSTPVGPVTYQQLISDQRDVISAQALIYSKQVVEANVFIRKVVMTDRNAKMASYGKSVESCRKEKYLKNTRKFTDKNKYGVQSRTGGDKKFGPARHTLRRIFYDKYRPNSSPSIRNPGTMLFNSDYRVATDCNKTRTLMLGQYLRSAMFFQQNLRYSIKEVYTMLDKQLVAARKLQRKHGFDLGPKLKGYPDKGVTSLAKRLDSKYAAWQ